MSDEIQGRTTKNRFYIKCKVTSKKFEYRDLQSRGRETNEVADAIFLIPQDATETDCFYSAWLPEKLSFEELKTIGRTNHPFNEIVMETGNPICGFFRGAIAAESLYCDRPHIFVMTKQAEEKLRIKIGQTINLTVLGDNEEEQLYELKYDTHSPFSDNL